MRRRARISQFVRDHNEVPRLFKVATTGFVVLSVVLMSTASIGGGLFGDLIDQVNKTSRITREVDKSIGEANVRSRYDVQKITKKLATPSFFSPWAAGLIHDQGGFYCGATLIKPGWAVTASYCLDDFNWTRVTVAYGSDELSRALTVRIEKVFLSPSSASTSSRYRLALLQLTSHTDDRVRQFPLVSSVSFNPAARSADARVVGWGSVSESGPLSPVLVQIDASIIDRELCNSPTWYAGSVGSDMLCAASKLPEIDACSGFGGSGLVAQSSREPELVGVLMWGTGCARNNKPNIYADVSLFSDWIRSVISENR